MSNQRPMIWLSGMDEDVESDCACPDVSRTLPEIHLAVCSNLGEHDCACPDTGLAPTVQPPLPPGPWRRPTDLYRAALPDEHEVVFAPLPSASIAVLNAPARRVLDGFAVPRRLFQITKVLPDLHPDDVASTALQLAQHGLLQPAEDGQTPCFAPPHTLTAWLHVTNQCNLRCAYCYVHKNGAAMDRNTGRAAIEAVFESALRHGFRAVKLKYAGGEPTLNFLLVCSLHLYAQTLAERHGLELREVLLSNGVALSDTILVKLLDMSMRLAISLDGVGPIHDAHRGRGTFVRTARTIDRAITLGLRPHLSITVTAQSVDSLLHVVNFALDRDLTFNLNFYREHKCTIRSADLGAENERLIEGMRAALALIEQRLPRQGFINGLLDRVNLSYPHSRPCGVGQSYVVIDHRGHVARCQMEMENVVGTVWDDDPLTAVRSAENGFRNLEVDAKGECGTCVWRYWCAGGCPLLTHRSTGRNDVSSPYCEVYRALFPDVLRLEGLRLLKWRPLAA